jgi:RimJ/RimL family protein N-acetyltransferase
VSEPPSSATLIDLHLENLYLFDERGRLRGVNDGTHRRPPRFVMALSHAAHRWLLRDDTDDELAERLDQLAATEPVTGSVPEWPQHLETYRDLLGTPQPIEREHCGPAYVLPPRPAGDDAPAVELAAGDRALLERHFPGWARDFEPSRPIGAVIEDGAIVAVCGCARRHTAAVEAGVETAEAYRDRGYARRATAVWASALRREGMLPLYSTEWQNEASRRVAASLGGVQYAVDFSIA